MPAATTERPALDKTSNAALQARVTELEAAIELLCRAVAGTSQAGRWVAQVIADGEAQATLDAERVQTGADRV